jgi:ubiquinone/menaquinone biosynthesis C-methylase UbiE
MFSVFIFTRQGDLSVGKEEREELKMYEGFANVYDHVMNHIPYETWFKQLKKYLEEHGVTSGTICELGCGTGTMTELFAGAGFQVIGVDKSADMLALAEAKKIASGADILYVQQEMENLELAEPVDVIISVCDSINYLLHEEEVVSTFERVHKYLKPGGFFIFDMKTVFCYRNIIGNQTWVEQDDEVSYIWENYYYEDRDINEYMLTIFKKQADGDLYERIEEAHYQKAYAIDNLKELVERTGLLAVESFDETMNQRPTENSERVYLVARARDESQQEETE